MKNKLFRFSYIIVSILILTGSFYLYKISREYLIFAKSNLLGNNNSNYNLLAKRGKGFPFSFAVLANTENSDAGKWLIEQLLKEDISFLIFCGDFANDPYWSEHILFNQNIMKINSQTPIFLVPDNHDILLEEKTSAEQFSLTDFNNVYGEQNFNFSYNNCLFIGISNVYIQEGKHLEYLDNVLSTKGNKAKHIFIFSSSPPRKLIYNIKEQDDYWGKIFNDLLDKYRFDYIISGDYHKHLAFSQNGKKYIILGSGGSHYHGQGKKGAFKNGMIFTVYDDLIKEEILICDKKLIFTDNSIRHWIYNNFFSVLKDRFWIISGILLLSFINMISSILLAIKTGI